MSEAPLRVLIVDDEAPARARLRDLLSDCAADVALDVVGEAGTARDALEVMAATPPDVLLLDIRMPKLDGIEALRHIKADAELRTLPVSMLTTTDDPREVARCYELGCNHYLVKPVDYEKFSEAIARLGSFISLVQVPEIHGKRDDT